jgi:hypothetical protein
MEGAFNLDPAFPSCLLRKPATSINDLPQEILQHIIGLSAQGSDIQVRSLPQRSKCCSLSENDVTRLFEAPFLVSRRFYQAACATLLPSLTLSATNMEETWAWIEQLAMSPKGQIKSLDISHLYWVNVMKYLRRPNPFRDNNSLARTTFLSVFSELTTIRLDFSI